MSYNTPNYQEQGGSRWVAGGSIQVASGGIVNVASGGSVNVASGGIINVATGGSIRFGGGALGNVAYGSVVLTNGGRVLAITSLASDLQVALAHSKQTAERITFGGKYYRRDIGFEFVG